MSSVEEILAPLLADQQLQTRIMIVVAHPDDETIGFGAQLCRFENALLVHITDGAPRDGQDMLQHGFAVLADYAAAREHELSAALMAGEAAAVQRATIGIADQEAWCDLAGLSRQVAQWLRRECPAAVLTHAYEGGHPDHDAAAFAVHAACRPLSAVSRPVIIEFPSYHACDGKFVTNRFLIPGLSEIVIRLDDADRSRKRRMVDCFRTQRELLARFQLDPERFRSAPAYDFRAPPHAGALLYEMFGWNISGIEWRRRAAQALDDLGLY